MNENEETNKELFLNRDKVIYDIYFSAHNTQLQLFRDIDNKAANIVSYVGIIFGVLVALVTSPQKDNFSAFESFCFFMSIFLFLVTFIFSLYAYNLKDIKVHSGLEHFMDKYVMNKEASSELILARISVKLDLDLLHNMRTTTSKGDYLELSFCTFGAAIIFTFLFIIHYIWI
jgi:hypothetical protein